MDTRDSAFERPVFVVGALRSGTTMLRLMLNHHPQVSFEPGELEFVVSQTTEEGRWPELRKYYDFLEADGMFNMLNPLPEVDRNLSYPDLVRSLFAQCHREKQASVVGSVVHSNFHRLPELWPKAKFVHIVRDPRDVALSCVKLGWAGNAYSGVDGWIAAERRWDLLKSRIPEDYVFEVKYEELVRAPTLELGRLCQFLGVDYDDRMLSYPKTSTYDAPDPSLLQGWRKQLDARQARLIESKAYPLLVSRGYVPSQVVPLTLNPRQLTLLTLDNRVRRAQKNIAKLGLPLWLAHQVTRFGPHSIRLGVARRLNAARLKALR